MTEKIPNGWRQVALGEIIDEHKERIGAGQLATVLSSTKYAGLVPSDEFFQNRRIYSRDISNYKKVLRGWFAYATNHLPEGSIGLQSDYDVAAVSPMYTVFEPRDGICPSFLFRVLKSPQLLNEYIKRENATVDRRGAVRFREFSTIQILLPPPDEQQIAADILDTIDTAIQNAGRVIAKQKAIRAGLLHDLLTYGLDANGEPRDPLMHPEQFQESIMGLIPKEWEVVRVYELAQIQLGLQRSPSRQRGEYIKPYLRVANVFDGWIDYSDVLDMNFTPAEQQNYDLLPGDILLNEGQSLELVGRCAIYDGPPNAYCFQNTLIRFRAYSRVLPAFCRIVFKQYLDNGDFMRVALQTTSVAHLGADRFANMLFLLPTIKEQVLITEKVAAENRVIETSVATLNKLIAQKKGLMDDLLTGRVRVSDVQMDEVM